MTTTNPEPRSITQARTAKDPEAYVARFNARPHSTGRGYWRAEVVSIDGTTASGQKRYTMRLTEVLA
jgi:hypothetical protein